MYRVSVTTIEKFRRYMNEVSPFDTEASLLESIQGLFFGNDKTKFGSAYHKVLEGEAKPGRGGAYVTTEDGVFIFSPEIAEPGIQFKIAHPLMIHEIPLRKIYESNYGPIQISSRVDGVEGIAVWDHKCKFRSVDWQEYIDSVQWKFYLDILELKAFYYNVFEVQGFDELPTKTPYFIKDVRIIHHEPMLCEAYENMQADMMQELNGFLQYVHEKNLTKFLKPAILQDDILNF